MYLQAQSQAGPAFPGSGPNAYMGMFMAMVQHTANERQEQMAAGMAADHRAQLLQRDMELALLKMKQEQELAAERARNRAQLQDANMKAMWAKMFNQ